MSLRFYDEAVKKQISKWVLDPHMTITSPDETRRLFSYRADLRDDKPVELPLIAIRRGRDVNIKNTNKRPLSFDAAPIASNKNKIKSLSGIPIELRYQLDIYTRYFDECDEYVRNFVYKFVNNPKLEVPIPYNGANISHYFAMILDPDIVDNSDIPERLVPGQFTRFTLSFSIPDAYLFSVPIRDAWKIEVDKTVDVRLKENIDTDISVELDKSLNSGSNSAIREVDASLNTMKEILDA